MIHVLIQHGEKHTVLIHCSKIYQVIGCAASGVIHRESGEVTLAGFLLTNAVIDRGSLCVCVLNECVFLM